MEMRSEFIGGRIVKKLLIQRNKKKRDWLPFVCIFPALLAMLFIHFIPSVIGIGISFLNFSSEALRDWSKADYIGLANYAKFFSSGTTGDQFLSSVKASLIYTIASLVLIVLRGLFAAMLLNQEGRVYRILRAVFLIGWILPNVVTGYIWKSMFLSESGPINAILMKMNIIDQPIYWIVGPLSIIPPIVANVWRSWPFAFITLLAGLQSIPQDLYDAADVDGANRLQKFFNITLPSLFAITRVMIMLLIVWTALDFVMVYTMYGYAPPAEANVIPVYVYNMGYQTWDFGKASAVSTLLMLVMLGLCILYVRSMFQEKKE